LKRITSPALVLRSTFVWRPRWKSACEVSVGQALVAALASWKSWVVVLPSVTTMGAAEAGL
jgi:hypothetical protein